MNEAIKTVTTNENVTKSESLKNKTIRRQENIKSAEYIAQMSIRKIEETKDKMIEWLDMFNKELQWLTKSDIAEKIDEGWEQMKEMILKNIKSVNASEENYLKVEKLLNSLISQIKKETLNDKKLDEDELGKIINNIINEAGSFLNSHITIE